MKRMSGLYWLLVVLSFLLSSGFAQDVRITEFMAKNGTGFVDEDGDSSDWIELYNASAAPVNLAGWRLTDDAADTSKWIFPGEVLPAGGYLVVFASDKDRRVAGSQLHTNFKLSGGGEYLGLLRPDGSAASAYAPAFPAQLDDVSFGFQTVVTASPTFVPEFAPARALVPTNAALGLSWIVPGFNDSGWTNGLTGIGYERGSGYGPLIGIDLEAQMHSLNPTAYYRVPFVVTNLSDLVSMTLSMKYDDGYIAYINGSRVAEARAPASPQWNSASISENPDGAAQVFEDMLIQTNFTSLLTMGTNVLAIHGLNRNTTSSDFLSLPRLTGVEGGYQSTALFLDNPTPGSANSGGALGFVDDPAFTIDRGCYSNPFTTVISCSTPGASLAWTIDGTVPSLSNGVVVAAANAAATPSAPVNISSTTVLRARAFLPGYSPSPTDTMTYLFIADVVQQTDAVTLAKGFPASWDGVTPDYGMDPDVIGPGDLFTNKYAATVMDDLKEIPSMSIVMPLDDLFGTAGIYSHPTSSGPAWERAASVEWIDPNSSEEFQIDCGIRIQGGAFRGFGLTRKKSFRLLFKSAYGPSKLRFPMFDHYPTATDEFDSIVLRMESNDGYSWNRTDQQYARDQFNRDTGLLLGQAHPHGTRVHLYINGVYWGLYNPVERPDANFAASYYGVNGEDWDGLNSGNSINATGDAARDTRTQNAWSTLVNLSQNVANQATEPLRNAAYQAVLGKQPDGSDDPTQERWLDETNYADYLIVNYWAGNSDWPRKNYYCGRENHPDSGGWRFFMWDSEWSLLMNSSVTINRLNDDRGVAVPFQDLRSCEEFRMMFGDRVHRAFFNGGPLEVDASNPDANPLLPVNNSLAVRYRALTDSLLSPLVPESARWGDMHKTIPQTVCGDFVSTRDEILTSYLPQRSAISLQQFKDAGLYPDIEAPFYSQHGDIVPAGYSLAMSATGTIYFTTDGSDPREIGGAIAGTAYTGPITLAYSTQVRARTRVAGQWSAMTDARFVVDAACSLRISEVMFNPRDAEGAEILAGFDAADFEYIELHNPTSMPIGLLGYTLSDGVSFDFDDGVIDVLMPGQRCLVVASEAGFTNRYGPGLPIAGTYTGTLADNGERIELSHPLLGCAISATYNDARCWPIEANGAGHALIALALTNLSQRLDYPGNWRASTYRDGSPGVADPVSATSPAVVINELAAHTDLADPAFPQYDSNDWIELYNRGATPVALGPDWYLSDDRGDLRKWALPASSLAPGAWLSFDEITGFHNPTNTGFGLRSYGEALFLSHLPGGSADRIVDAIAFKAQANGLTLGRLPDGADHLQALTPTRDTTNAPAAQSVRINEIHYHPVMTGTNDNDADEFIELYNPLTTPVSMASAAGPWRIDGIASYDFPAGATLAANGHALLVRFDPAGDLAARSAFEATYGLAPGTVPMFGPYTPRLSNRAGRLSLEFSLDPGEGWGIIDEVFYADAAPWDPAADGNGASLHRVAGYIPGKVETNWVAAAPSPGAGVPQETNPAPRLAPIPAVIIDEGMTASFTASATDSVGQVVTYSLGSGAPAGATIHPLTGVFSLPTGEADGPSTNLVPVLATDNGSPTGIGTQWVLVVINEVNQAPMLAPIPNQTVVEGQAWSYIAAPSDADLPGQALSTSLLPGAPPGLLLSPGGSFSWTPAEADGPGTQTVSVVVTDGGSPSLSVTQSFTISVLEENRPPALSPIPTVTLIVGAAPQTLPLLASDPDLPGQTLGYALAGPALPGISISNQLVTIDPLAVGTVLVVAVVSDSFIPPASATQQFQVVVEPVVIISDISELNAGLSRVYFPSLNGASYELDVSPSLVTPAWSLVGSATATGAQTWIDHSHAAAGIRFYRVRRLP